MSIRDRIKELRRVKASELLPSPKNWRTHPQAQKDAMTGVLEQVGYADAVLARETPDGLMLIDGHLRAEVTPDTEIPVLVLDVNEAEADIILATHDPLAAMAGASTEMLDGLLGSIEIDSDAVQSMLDDLAAESGIEDDTPAIVEDEAPIDKADELQKEWKTETGQLWIIEGKQTHRLLCGDSTKVADVERVVGGEKADCVLTDPPYGVSYQSNMRTKSKKFEVIENDGVILDGWIAPADANSTGFFFVWTSWKVLEEWLGTLSGVLGKPSNIIVWDKGGGGIGDLKKTFSTDYELCLVYHRGNDLTGKRIGSVWSVGKDAAAGYSHPTQKPVEIMAIPIRNTTVPHAVVYDPFLGSGTTMAAADQLNRKCFGLELSPKYCAVILERMKNLGCEPRLETK